MICTIAGCQTGVKFIERGWWEQNARTNHRYFSCMWFQACQDGQYLLQKQNSNNHNNNEKEKKRRGGEREGTLI